jgi:hypothetical protein
VKPKRISYDTSALAFVFGNDNKQSLSTLIGAIETDARFDGLEIRLLKPRLGLSEQIKALANDYTKVVVGFSFTTSKALRVLQEVRDLRRSGNVALVAGGPHPSGAPDAGYGVRRRRRWRGRDQLPGTVGGSILRRSSRSRQGHRLSRRSRRAFHRALAEGAEPGRLSPLCRALSSLFLDRDHPRVPLRVQILPGNLSVRRADAPPQRRKHHQLGQGVPSKR